MLAQLRSVRRALEIDMSIRTAFRGWTGLVVLACSGALAGCTNSINDPATDGAAGSGSSGGSAGSAGSAGSGLSSNGGGSAAQGGGGPIDCAAESSLPPRLYRLSTDQFSNAVRDLLQLPTGPIVGGDTEAELTFYPRVEAPVQPGLASGFSSAVRSSLQAVDLGTLSGCGAAAEAACAQQYIDELASRAFRRPLDQADKDALYGAATSPYALGALVSVNHGLELAVEAILQAPSFVYRRELAATADQRLDGFETASQLSFLLGDSIPDPELWQAALSGQLTTDEQIGAQLDRLLERPEVQATVTRIVGAWFGVEKVLAANKDPAAFPNFNDSNLQAALLESVRLFIADSLWTEGGSLRQLLTSPRVYMNRPLASALGVTYTDPSGGSVFERFEMPLERAGIMTQPALMAGFASSLDTSVVKRGLFVVRRALCLTEPPQPTGAILVEVQKQLEDETTTERQKADFRAANSCNACHQLFDAYGLALESYDAIGRYRTTDKNGAPIDASSQMREDIVLAEAERAADGDDLQPINGALEFVNGVAQTDVFTLCGNKQLLSYAVGREVEESCVPREGLSLNMTIKEIFHKIVLSDLARKRVPRGAP